MVLQSGRLVGRRSSDGYSSVHGRLLIRVRTTITLLPILVGPLTYIGLPTKLYWSSPWPILLRPPTNIALVALIRHNSEQPLMRVTTPS